MAIAINAQGDALWLDKTGKWVPTKLATNPQSGERLALDGDTWIAIPTEKPSAFVDAARAIPGGIAKGIASVAGLPGSVSDLMSSGLDYLGNKIMGANISTAKSPFSGSALEEYAGKPTGGYYEPKTTLGQYAQTAAEFAPAAFGGEASLAERALGRVLAPAITSETLGRATKGRPYEGAARLAGAVLGGSPASVLAGGRAITEGVIPRLAEPLPAEDANLVQQYEAMGGHLRPAQYSPSNFIRQGDAVIADSPFPRASGFAPNSQTAILPGQQADEFNRMLSQTFGENAPRLTDDVLQQAYRRIGRVYETVLPRNNISASPDLETSLGNVENNVLQAAPAMNSPDVVRVQNVLESIRNQVANGGSLSGRIYQTYRQRGGILDELAGSDSPVLQRAGTDIRRALDDAFIQQADPYDAAALTQARNQYRNLETLRPLASRAPAGNISPGLVLGAVNREFDSPAAAGDLGTLARVGAAYLRPQVSSGTSERQIWRSLVNKPFSEGLPAVANAVVGLPVSAVGARAVNRMINSPAMRNRLLANALMNQPQAQISNASLAPYLMRPNP